MTRIVPILPTAASVLFSPDAGCDAFWSAIDSGRDDDATLVAFGEYAEEHHDGSALLLGLKELCYTGRRLEKSRSGFVWSNGVIYRGLEASPALPSHAVDHKRWFFLVACRFHRLQRNQRLFYRSLADGYKAFIAASAILQDGHFAGVQNATISGCHS